MKNDTIEKYVPKVKLITSASDTDALVSYLQGETGKELSPALRTYYDRLNQTAEWARKYKSRAKVIPMLLNHTWRDAAGIDYKISESQAYRDWTDSQIVFAPVNANSKMFLIDAILGDMAATRAMCLAGDKKDLKTAASIEKNMAEIISEHFGDADAELYRNLQIPTIRVTTDPSILPHKLPEDWREQAKQFLSHSRVNSKDIPEAQEVKDDE